jgi:hypothetical protein
VFPSATVKAIVIDDDKTILDGEQERLGGRHVLQAFDDVALQPALGESDQQYRRVGGTDSTVDAEVAPRRLPFSVSRWHLATGRPDGTLYSHSVDEPRGWP